MNAQNPSVVTRLRDSEHKLGPVFIGGMEADSVARALEQLGAVVGAAAPELVVKAAPDLSVVNLSLERLPEAHLVLLIERPETPLAAHLAGGGGDYLDVLADWIADCETILKTYRKFRHKVSIVESAAFQRDPIAVLRRVLARNGVAPLELGEVEPASETPDVIEKDVVLGLIVARIIEQHPEWRSVAEELEASALVLSAPIATETDDILHGAVAEFQDRHRMIDASKLETETLKQRLDEAEDRLGGLAQLNAEIAAYQAEKYLFQQQIQTLREDFDQLQTRFRKAVNENKIQSTQTQKARDELEEAVANLKQAWEEAAELSNERAALEAEKALLLERLGASEADLAEILNAQSRERDQIKALLADQKEQFEKVVVALQNERREALNGKVYYKKLHEEAKHRADLAQVKIKKLEHDAVWLKDELEGAKARIAAMEASTSWTLTKPLRGVVSMVKGHPKPEG